MPILKNINSAALFFTCRLSCQMQTCIEEEAGLALIRLLYISKHKHVQYRKKLTKFAQHLIQKLKTVLRERRSNMKY